MKFESFNEYSIFAHTLLQYLLTHAVLSVAASHTVSYLLLHAVQLVICCHMQYSLLFVATYRTVCFSYIIMLAQVNITIAILNSYIASYT